MLGWGRTQSKWAILACDFYDPLQAKLRLKLAPILILNPEPDEGARHRVIFNRSNSVAYRAYFSPPHYPKPRRVAIGEMLHIDAGLLYLQFLQH
jgi:hypothetical protein